MDERSILPQLTCFGAVLFAVGGLVLALEVPVATLIAPNASGCDGGITTFQACNSMVSVLNECNSATGQYDCFCQQDVFNLFYE
jgi:hypothetical protein